MNKTKILLVGIGGYGGVYVDIILDKDLLETCSIEGIVDPFAQNCRRIQELEALNIPVYSSMNEFYKRHEADLAVISSPIQFHAHQTITAVKNGSHVLCEKPVCATIEDAIEMEKTAALNGKFVEIGYQWSHDSRILELKKDIISGIYGRPLMFKTMVLWQRDNKYYSRNEWAGKIMDNRGNYIFDSVANNATAHYLYNMLFLLGDGINSSEDVSNAYAEVYRSHKIDNYDTIVLKGKTKKDTEILYIASHATGNNRGPVFEFEFENAKVSFDMDSDNVLRAFKGNNEIKSYGKLSPQVEKKLVLCLEKIKNPSVLLPCPLSAAITHTRLINEVQKSIDKIYEFDDVFIVDNMENRYFPGLEGDLSKCYEKCDVPYSLGFKWARKGTKFVVDSE